MSDSTDCTQNRDLLRLVREGTSQEQRHNPALDPGYAPVDERAIEHRMTFARAYARFLKYFAPDNVAEGDWQLFFDQDVLVQLAVAAVQDVDYYKSTLKGFFDFLNNREHESDEENLRLNLGYLFSCAATLALRLDALQQGLPPEIALKGVLQNLIQSQLAPALRKLIAYRKADDLIEPKSDRLVADAQPEATMLGGTTLLFSEVVNNGLSSLWQTEKTASWKEYLDAVQPEASVFGSGSVFERINHIATHNLFTSIFDQFLKAYALTVGNAKQELAKNLTNWDLHEPHYGLFLAFLRLFEYARTEVNTLTGRHLDLYYREILRLKEKGAQPGHAHLLVELAKQAPGRDFPAGELFQAGKDGRGIEAFFANDRDFVANQAKVAARKTVYRHNDAPKETLPRQNGRLFASPVADSDDGKGAELTTADKSWHPFYNKSYQFGLLSEIRMPKAEIGFALASHYLLLAQGARTIRAEFTVSSAGKLQRLIQKHKASREKFPGKVLNQALLDKGAESTYENGVTCLLTGEKGWLEKAPTTFKAVGNLLTLEIPLNGADPAVVPYLAKTHGYDFSTDLPMLLLKLRHLDTADYLYPGLEEITITGINLSVAVQGLRTLTVSNNFGPVDTSKPFQPFGAQPAAQSALVIGAQEAFQKALTAATVKVQWQTAPAPYKKSINVTTEYLQDGAWQPSGMPATDIGSSSFPLQFGASSPCLDAADLSAPDYYTTSARSGFVRLKLSDDFGQSDYEQDLIDYLKQQAAAAAATSGTGSTPLSAPAPQQASDTIAKVSAAVGSDMTAAAGKKTISIAAQQISDTASKQQIDTVIMKPSDAFSTRLAPTGPFIIGLTLDYNATQTIALDTADSDQFAKRPARFFHLAPFGYAEQHPYLKIANQPSQAGLSDSAIYLLHQLKHLNAADASFPTGHAVPHEAEFYLGVTGLKPPQNLALLFQVADGTADPLSDKPDPHINWSYLRANEWVTFASNEVQDGTGGLLNSGIVSFAVPRDASDSGTLLPPGMHWIRAAVASHSDAVCRLRLVEAQALEATFRDQGNDPAFPAQLLPPGTIIKLQPPDAAVKKITQPFPSFGGRGQESAPAFYTRVSERLRHKDRAIALWDYERLVLEAFPQIFKARCLHHTQYEPNETGTGIYRELAPGHVTVVTVPDQQYHNLRDPLRPYTSLGLLKEIEVFLSKRLSCFVSLHVKNPQFEEVSVGFKVRLYDGFDETFSVLQLQQAVTRFLSPWAFPGGGSPSFGGKVYKSVLINFVEDLPYVDYVIDFSLTHQFQDDSGTWQTIEKNEVEASKAISILVSSGQHAITSFKPAELALPGEKCPCAA